jgi:hypothetical protein
MQPTAQAVGRKAPDNKAPKGRKNRVGRTLLSDASDFDLDPAENEQDACSIVEERRFSPLFLKRHIDSKNKAREGHDFSRAALSWPKSGFSR